MPKTPSERDLAAILIGHGIVDFVSGGRLTKIERNLLWKVLKKSLPILTRAGVGTAKVAGRSAIGAATPIVQSPAFPYVAGAALGYGALQTEPGQQLLEMAEDRGRMDRIRYEQALTNLEYGVKSRVKKTKSKFNSAVSKGMKAIRNSTSYGKKGVINAPKKAFKVVTQMASKINKAKKTKGKLPPKPKSKVLKLLYNSMVGIFR